jgi:hypothetical protein
MRQDGRSELSIVSDLSAPAYDCDRQGINSLLRR